MESYGLDTRFGKAVAAQVLVNDVLAGEVQDGHDSFQSLPLQADVVRGRNRLDVLLAIAPHDPAAPPPPGDPETMFAELILELDKVRDLGDRYEITTSEVEARTWRAAAGAPVERRQRIAIEWNADGTTGDPIWVRAAPGSMEVALPAIATELRLLRDLLAARRLDAFQLRMRHRNEDMARAYPMTGSADKRAAADTEMLDRMLPLGPVPFAAVAADRLRLRSFAGGRVIGCVAADGHPPLRCLVPGGEPIYIATTFAMVDGAMAVIR